MAAGMLGRPDTRRTAALVGLGALLLAGVYGMHSQVDLAVENQTFVALGAAMTAVCGMAAWLLWRKARRRDVAIVLVVALCARGLLAFDLPTLSDDAYRFVWDGRVQAQGINPYRFAPADRELGSLRDWEVFTQVNRPFTETGYPPVNELAFAGINGVAGEGTTQVKLGLLAVEALAVALLLWLLARAGVSRGRVALYAWSPLAIVEIAGSGHPEPLLVVFTLAALLLWDRGRPAGAGLALGAAVMTKLVPLVLAPFMVRRLGVRFALAGMAGALLLAAPYVGAGPALLGSLDAYSGERFGAGPFRWLTGLGVDDGVVRALLLAALTAGVAWTAARPPRDLRRAAAYCALLLAGVLLASHNFQPWYALWVLPFLCLTPIPALLWLCAAAPVLYLGFGPSQLISEGEASAIVWVPTVALLAASAAHRALRLGLWARVGRRRGWRRAPALSRG
jgi:alpha-1,6-mannosyltransferase